MFMQKIEAARVTCDLFAVTKGFDGTGGAGVDAGKGPRTATENEARAYADFIRRKVGAPDLGNVQMERDSYPGRGGFYYVGATFGAVTDAGGWHGEAGHRQHTPAQYEAGAFSVLFPGANQMRAKVTLETLGDDGEAISSQTMPIEPKKGGVVWSKDDVRKACGPVAKVKAARTPTRIKRGPIPVQSGADADKRRRAVLMALRLRKQLRRAEQVSSDRFREIMRLSRETQPVRPDTPATAPDAILSDLAEAEALMRGEGYVAPAPVYAKPERVRIRSTVIGGLPYGRLQEDAFVVGQAGGFEAMTGSNPAAWHYQREGRSTAYGDGFPTREDALAALDSFLVTLDAPEPLPVTPEPAPTVDESEAAPSSGQAKRTPAHERAIRRAWAERAAFRKQRAMAGEVKAELKAAWQVQAELQDRAALAEQEAAEAMAAREDLKRMLADAERRLAAAEAENAQLWAEIEGLTAPVPALAA